MEDLKEMSELMDKLQKLTMMDFVIDNYCKGDIKKFVKALDEMNTNYVDLDDDDNIIKSKNYFDRIHNDLSKLEVITKLLYTKKIVENRKDLLYIANYLRKISDNIEKIGLDD